MNTQTFFEQHLQYKKIERLVKENTELTLNEAWILNELLESNVLEVELDYLKNMLDISHALIHKYIKRLEANKYIYKSKSEIDHRKWIIKMNNKELENTMAVLEIIEQILSE